MTVDVKRLGMVWLREAMLGEEDGSLQAPSALEYGCGELYSWERGSETFLSPPKHPSGYTGATAL